MSDVAQRAELRHLTRDVGCVAEAMLLKVGEVELTQKQRMRLRVIVESCFCRKAGSGKTCAILSISSRQGHAQKFFCGNRVNSWL